MEKIILYSYKSKDQIASTRISAPVSTTFSLISITSAAVFSHLLWSLLLILVFGLPSGCSSSFSCLLLLRASIVSPSIHDCHSVLLYPASLRLPSLSSFYYYFLFPYLVITIFPSLFLYLRAAKQETME